MNYWAAPELIGRVKISRMKMSKEMIFRAVCKEYEVTPEQISAKTRKRKFIEPRHITCYLLRKYANIHWEDIGAEFNQDHTTAMNAFRAVKDRMDTESDFKARVERLINNIF